MRKRSRWCFGVFKEESFKVVKELRYHEVFDNPIIIISTDNEVEYYKALIVALKECNHHNIKIAEKLGYNDKDNEDEDKLRELWREHSITREVHWAVDQLRWYGIDVLEDDEYLADIYNFYSTTTFEEMEELLNKYYY